MLRTVWFITAGRGAIDWETAVVDGVAQIDIYQLDRYGDVFELLFLFARAGQQVSAQRVTDAQDLGSEDPVPAQIVPTSSAGGGVAGADGWARWIGTQAEYDAVDPKDPNTLYVVTD